MPVPATPHRDFRTALAIPALFLCLVLAMIGSLALGRYPVPLPDILRIVLTTPPFGAVGDPADTGWVVVELVRLPRILEVALCGMGLAMAGTAMQGVFRNPLIGPEIGGVSAGAMFGGVLGILVGWSAWGIVGSAFVFGILALVVAFALAGLAGRGGMLALVLSGVIVGSFFGAAVGLTQYLADPQTKLPAITYWLLGSFAGATYDKVAIVAAIVLGAGTLLMGLRWRLNLLSLGETDAGTLGIPVRALRWTIVVLVALIVAAQISVSGAVGFVGLVVPHLARMLVGPEHTRLMPAAAFLGGLYLLAMDDIARSAAAIEIPIGLLTAFVGAPIFASLFWRYQGRGWTDA
jgi:iron complex transport system permease protein